MGASRPALPSNHIFADQHEQPMTNASLEALGALVLKSRRLQLNVPAVETRWKLKLASELQDILMSA